MTNKLSMSAIITIAGTCCISFMSSCVLFNAYQDRAERIANTVIQVDDMIQPTAQRVVQPKPTLESVWDYESFPNGPLKYITDSPERRQITMNVIERNRQRTEGNFARALARANR